jgi:hypothetical protein
LPNQLNRKDIEERSSVPSENNDVEFLRFTLPSGGILTKTTTGFIAKLKINSTVVVTPLKKLCASLCVTSVQTPFLNQNRLRRICIYESAPCPMMIIVFG